MRPLHLIRLPAVIALLLASSALAQSEVSTTTGVERTHPSGEIFSARLRYGVVMREGTQDDSGPGLSYDGLTPNDVELKAAYFPVDLIGAELSLEREGFSLNSDSTGLVTSGTLLRAHAGPKARVKFGPLKIELIAAFQYAQLPLFGSTVAPQLRAGSRNAVLLASRIVVDLPADLNLQARGEYPITLSASDGQGNSATSSGYAFGGGLGYTLGWADKVSYGIVLDFQRVSDRLEVSDGTVSTQTLNRIGGGIELAWNDAPPGPPPPKFGGLLLTLVDEESGARRVPDHAVGVRRAGQLRHQLGLRVRRRPWLHARVGGQGRRLRSSAACSSPSSTKRAARRCRTRRSRSSRRARRRGH